MHHFVDSLLCMLIPWVDVWIENIEDVHVTIVSVDFVALHRY